MARFPVPEIYHDATRRLPGDHAPRLPDSPAGFLESGKGSSGLR
jgi:hypothetical protein